MHKQTKAFRYASTARLPVELQPALLQPKQVRGLFWVEPTARIGGLVTSGLSHADFHSFESLSGAYLDFANRVQEYYTQRYSQGSPQWQACFRGTFAEPHVNLRVFEAMLADHANILCKKTVFPRPSNIASN